MTENLDAMRALEHVPFEDRAALKAALGTTMVKHHGHWKAFETVLDVYFALWSGGIAQGEGEGDETDDLWEQLREQAAADGGGAMGDVSNEELARMLLDALMQMDREAMRQLAAAAALGQPGGQGPGERVDRLLQRLHLLA